ncbi:hypothetical protein POSPLADRAFT_1158859, partial [Postia placenta MAD-698-R-SB12]
NSSVSALQWAVLVLTDAWLRSRAPPLPPPITVADEFFDCSRLEHAFDTQEQVDVSRDDPKSDGDKAPFFICDRQPCPNRTPRSITVDEGHFVPIRRVQHPRGPALRYAGTSRSTSRHVTPVPSRPASPGTRIPQPVASTGQARGDPHLPRGTEAVAQPSATPQAIPQPSLGPRLERPPKTEPRDTPPHSWASSSSAVTASTSVPVLRHPASGLPQPASPPSPPQGRSSTRSSRSSPGGQSQQSPPSAGSPSSPSSPIMSSPPAAVLDKETLKLLLPLRYDGKTVIDCDRFLSQLRIYWMVNTSLTTIELKVQVALSLLDGDARAWATPYFAQLVSVQIGVQGATTPFANEAAFAAAFKARFGNLDDEVAAQVELAKLCADKSVREKRTAAEFSALFKGPADRSGYGDLELRDKYLSGIPSRVYRKIELETFTTWQDADKRATEVEQILDISRARRPELNNFFSTQGRGRGGARGGAPSTHAASASINAAVGKGNFPGTCFGCGKQGYRRFECPNCKDKPYTKCADARATVASGSTQAATSAPVTTTPSASISAASAKSEQSELADLMAQVKSMREELEHYRAMKEEGF